MVHDSEFFGANGIIAGHENTLEITHADVDETVNYPFGFIPKDTSKVYLQVVRMKNSKVNKTLIPILPPFKLSPSPAYIALRQESYSYGVDMTFTIGVDEQSLDIQYSGGNTNLDTLLTINIWEVV